MSTSSKVRTRRLAGGELDPLTARALYTVPALHTVIWKSFAVWARPGAAGPLMIGVLGDGATWLARVFVWQVQSDVHQYRDQWIVLQPGDQIYASYQGTVGVTYVLSGAILEGTTHE